MGIGGLFQDLLHDKGVQDALAGGKLTPKQIYQWSMLGGAAIGALDMFPAAKFTGKLFGKKAATDLIKKSILHGIMHGMIDEGWTEGTQGLISEIGQAILGGNIDLAQRALSVLNQALAGAVGGAGPGGVGQHFENNRVDAEQARRDAEAAAAAAAAGAGRRRRWRRDTAHTTGAHRRPAQGAAARRWRHRQPARRPVPAASATRRWPATRCRLARRARKSSSTRTRRATSPRPTWCLKRHGRRQPSLATPRSTRR
jgi:hypothetical protein